MDVKYLVGKSIPELINYKYQSVSNGTNYNKVYIPLKAGFYDDKEALEGQKTFKLMCETFEFIRSTINSTLLIVGESGSGKSTF